MKNQPTQNKISHPPLGGFRIFYICALIFYILFYRNEPNFFFSKNTVSVFLNKTNAWCIVPLACNSNPIQTQTGADVEGVRSGTPVQGVPGLCLFPAAPV